MSDEETTQEATTEKSTKEVDEPSKSSNKGGRANSILLIPYPKFVFMYPTLIVSFIAAIVLSISSDATTNLATQNTPVIMTGIFLVVMMANMFVIVFDFPRATSLTLLFIVTTVGLGLWMWQGVLPSTGGWLSGLRPAANATFYWCITAAMMLMYGAVLVSVKFNYWELRNNELLHHHGFLSDLKRYPAPNLRVDKEINDVFEFLLLGAGRLILHPSTEKRAIVLDNILFVGRKERELTKMLGSIKVQIGSDSGVH